jgi:hypothetical protein
VALGCALWADVRRPCPLEDAATDPEWGAQRIANLMAAWRDQLLEVLGAMGLREVRRLRGELGRTIFQVKEEGPFARLGQAVAGHRELPSLNRATADWRGICAGRRPDPGDCRAGPHRPPATSAWGIAWAARVAALTGCLC